MMILRSAAASPFGRKVKITASELGLMDRMTIEPTDTMKPDAGLTKANPLNKIPVLILADGSTLYDSQVICEYLDWLSPQRKVLPTGADRFPVLRLAALADGIKEAALLLVYEKRLRPEATWSAAWMENQSGKIERSLALLEEAPPAMPGPPDLGHIGVAAALGYLDLRHGGIWRTGHPRLVQWLDTFIARVPSFEATRVKA